MSLRLLEAPITEYEHLVWCPACKYGIVMWSQIAREGEVGHGCMECRGQMEVFHRGCPMNSPITREVPGSKGAST